MARQHKTAVCANIILHYLQFPCHYSGWGQIGPKLGGSLGNFGKYKHINVNILTFTKLKINININLYITLVMRLIMESNTYIFNRLKPLLVVVAIEYVHSKDILWWHFRDSNS